MCHFTNELLSAVIGIIIGVFVQAKTDLWANIKKSKQLAHRDVMESLDALVGAIHGLYEENNSVAEHESSQNVKIEDLFNKQIDVLNRKRSLVGEDSYRIFQERNLLLRKYYAFCHPKSTKIVGLNKRNEIWLNLYIQRFDTIEKS